MANNYQNDQRSAQDKAIPRDTKERELSQFSATAFNISGFSPTTSYFKLTETQLKTELLKIAKSFVPDIIKATIEVDYERGELEGYLWLPYESDNLNDKTTNESMLGRSIPRYSKELREFIDKFCPNNKKYTVKAGDGLERSYTGIIVCIDRLLNITFDKNGKQFRERYGNYSPACNISYHAKFAKGDGKSYGKFRYVEIRKALTSDRDQLDPRPKKSFNI